MTLGIQVGQGCHYEDLPKREARRSSELWEMWAGEAGSCRNVKKVPPVRKSGQPGEVGRHKHTLHAGLTQGISPTNILTLVR